MAATTPLPAVEGLQISKMKELKGVSLGLPCAISLAVTGQD